MFFTPTQFFYLPLRRKKTPLKGRQNFAFIDMTKIYIKFCGFRMIDQLFLNIFRSITITVLQLEFGL